MGGYRLAIGKLPTGNNRLKSYSRLGKFRGSASQDNGQICLEQPPRTFGALAIFGKKHQWAYDGYHRIDAQGISPRAFWLTSAGQ